jgi:hypothetical protein
MMTVASQHEIAHRALVNTPFQDIVKSLSESLGKSLVAYLAGVEAKTVSRWCDGSTARPAAEKRVMTAFQVVKLLGAQDCEHTVRAWFIGLNPQLGDVSPAQALRDDKLREVVIAAKAFVAGG